MANGEWNLSAVSSTALYVADFIISSSSENSIMIMIMTLFIALIPSIWDCLDPY